MSAMQEVDLDLSQMSESDRKTLQSFLTTIQKREQMRQNVDALTSVCWEKCIFKVKPVIDAADEKCLKSCVGRYLESSMFLANRLNENHMNQ